MLRHELEKRIRHLETGLDQFSGLDWIVKVGEIAEIKGAVLDMTAEMETDCARGIRASELETLDADIACAICQGNGQPAFEKACGTLRTWLTPALPGQRKPGFAENMDLA